jgi:cytochrome c556
MANEIIKPRRFEVAKNKIQTLAHNVPSTVSLNKFPTEGSIFSRNNHNITGSEANELLVYPLQSTLIAQNSNIRSLFNIADEVYKALESLDKEYIAGIIASIESAKVASGQAKTASTKAEQASMQAFEASQKALEASKKANNAQDDIKKTIEGLKRTVQVLKEFKEKVAKDLGIVSSLNTQTASIKNRVQNIEHEEEQTKGKVKFLEERIRHIGIKINSISEAAEVLQSIQPYLSNLSHIKDVDTIWNDVESQKTNLAGFHQQVDAFIERVNRTTERIHGDIAALQQYRSMLESFQHLSDIDTIWNDVESQKTNLAGFHQQVGAFIERVNRTTECIHGDIAALQQYRSMLESFQHLSDVDAIWNDVEGHKTDLADFHQQVDAFIERVNRTIERIHGDIVALQQYRSMLESFQHLGDIDTIWNDVESHKANLVDFHQQVDAFIERVNRTTERIHGDIAALQQYRSMLESFQHLGDVDAIWNDVEDHKTDLADFHQQVNNFISEVHTAHDEIKISIKDLEDVNTASHVIYEKRIKTAYYVGGTALGLSIINYILQILGVY